MTIQERAAQAASFFERAERSPAGENGEAADTFVRFTDSAPEWIRHAVYAAHGAMLPDDHVFETVLAALEAIGDEQGDPEDARHEFADGCVDIYNTDRVAWLASSLYRDGFCQEAIEEYGADGIGGAFDLIGRGQYVEAAGIYDTMLSALGEQTDE